MQHYHWPQIFVDKMNELVTRQVIHSETMTMARLLLKKGAYVGLHSHPNEQISTIESGSLRFEVGGKEITVYAGETLVIPPNVPHLAEAHEDCVAMDVFSPVRQDWINGEDAYLRSGSADWPGYK